MKPILFQGEGVRGILEGRKTQTRRVINRPTPYQSVLSHGQTWLWNGPGRSNKTLAIPQGLWLEHCPYGQVGDRLWVRETFSNDIYHSSGSTLYRADGTDVYTEYGTDREHKIHWKPSIHMFRRDSRITLEITGVKVERIQDISVAGIQAEGIPDDRATFNAPKQMAKWRDLWDSINAKRGYGWDANPWVWALTFKVVAPI